MIRTPIQKVRASYAEIDSLFNPSLVHPVNCINNISRWFSWARCLNYIEARAFKDSFKLASESTKHCMHVHKHTGGPSSRPFAPNNCWPGRLVTLTFTPVTVSEKFSCYWKMQAQAKDHSHYPIRPTRFWMQQSEDTDFCKPLEFLYAASLSLTLHQFYWTQQSRRIQKKIGIVSLITINTQISIWRPVHSKWNLIT